MMVAGGRQQTCQATLMPPDNLDNSRPVEYREKVSIQSTNAFREGIEFLLNHQKPDGSWHVATRSKPVQVSLTMVIRMERINSYRSWRQTGR